MDNRKPIEGWCIELFRFRRSYHRSLEAVKAAGGSIVLSNIQVGPLGDRALIADTEGNVVALYAKADVE